jgi:hypothetical protein
MTATVIRARDARIYPLRRPDGVTAPLRLDARVGHAHDAAMGVGG